MVMLTDSLNTTIAVNLDVKSLTKQNKHMYFRSTKSQAVSIDSFTIAHNFHMCYIYSHFSLMGQVLKKMQEDGRRAVAICTLGATLSWFPLSLGMIKDNSFILPRITKLLCIPQKPDRHDLV